MTTATLDDHRLRLGVVEIGLLDESAFVAAAPALTGPLTVALWFAAESTAGTQVIANVSNRSIAHVGWTLLLAGGEVVFRHKRTGSPCVEIAAPLEDDRSWHHVAATVDLAAARLRLRLDGVAVGSRQRSSAERVDPAAVSVDSRLFVGGYTDDAGGHFDHRFGHDGCALVDDLRLYDRVLDAEEIAVLARSRRVTAEVSPSIDISPAGGPAPLDVTLSAGPRPAGSTFCVWDLGDGRRALGQAVSHRYLYAGRFTVSLRAVTGHVDRYARRTVEVSGRADPSPVAHVFENGVEGHACYRIPAIVETLDGQLLAFAEGRVHDCSDATSAIRIVCKRSADGGATWGALQVVARNVVEGEERACMNPSPVVDATHGTGRIVVVFNKQEHDEWAVAAGLGVNRVFCATSDDHGATWSEREITAEVHRPRVLEPADWRKQVPTLGHAIQLTGGRVAGRLFYVGGRTEGDASVFETWNYAFWSDDLGVTWQTGPTIERRADGTAARGLGEATAVELVDGSIVVNSRSYRDGRPVGLRTVTRGTFDVEGALRFASARDDLALVDSGVQASLLRCRRGDDDDRLLFSNPAHPRARRQLTVRTSRDGGRTWPVATVIDPGPCAYSDLVERRDGTVGVLYERGNHGGIVFREVPLDPP